MGKTTKHNEFVTWLVEQGFTLQRGAKHVKVYWKNRIVLTFNFHGQDLYDLAAEKRRVLRKAAQINGDRN